VQLVYATVAKWDEKKVYGLVGWMVDELVEPWEQIVVVETVDSMALKWAVWMA